MVESYQLHSDDPKPMLSPHRDVAILVSIFLFRYMRNIDFCNSILSQHQNNNPGIGFLYLMLKINLKALISSKSKIKGKVHIKCCNTC